MKRILVVEDEVDIRDIIHDLLEAKGFQVLCADDGLAGLQLAREQLPDLIISDILMPKMDGYDMLDELRRDPVRGSIAFEYATFPERSRKTMNSRPRLLRELSRRLD